MRRVGRPAARRGSAPVTEARGCGGLGAARGGATARQGEEAVAPGTCARRCAGRRARVCGASVAPVLVKIPWVRCPPRRSGFTSAEAPYGPTDVRRWSCSGWVRPRLRRGDGRARRRAPPVAGALHAPERAPAGARRAARPDGWPLRCLAGGRKTRPSPENRAKKTDRRAWNQPCGPAESGQNAAKRVKNGARAPRHASDSFEASRRAGGIASPDSTDTRPGSALPANQAAPRSLPRRSRPGRSPGPRPKHRACGRYRFHPAAGSR